MPSFGSLFSGIGGMDLGLERAGWECRWQVELDDFCRSVLTRHWPAVPKWGDIRTVTGQELEPVDLIAGGFPCKQTSSAAAVHGRRLGLEGEDSGLWREQLRIICERRPDWALVENVAGVGRWSTEIAGGLAGAGYRVSRLDLSAARVGAPHLRRRVFFVANAHGARLPVAWEDGPPEAVRHARRTADRDAWLSSLAGVLRVADGLPGGVDRRQRITALGNAVVPQVAEHIGRRLLASLPAPPPH